jgi:hypothetical protein
VTIDGVWVGYWIYSYNSELHLIIVSLLIPTVYRSLQHSLSLFQPAVFNSRSLATASNSGDSSASRNQVLLWQPPVQNSCQFPPANCQLSTPESESESHIATDGQSISKSWCRAPSGARDQIFITLWQLRSCFYGPHSLTRGRVCLVYMVLALASVVFIVSQSLWTYDHILLSQIWDFPFVAS